MLLRNKYHMLYRTSCLLRLTLFSGSEDIPFHRPHFPYGYGTQYLPFLLELPNCLANGLEGRALRQDGGLTLSLAFLLFRLALLD